jgi:hypothetical protein
MADYDSQILALSRKLFALKQKKRKAKSSTRNIKISSKLRRRGREPVDPVIIAEAKKLAEKMSIIDVCFKLDISRATLDRYGVKRSLIPRKT